MKKRTTSSTLKIIRLILITLIFLLPNKSLAIVSQTSEFYVNDYSQVLNEETKNYIINANIELQKKTEAQIVVVTVKSLEGKSIEEYATELFRKFGIGNSSKNNGVLLLCSTGDRLFRIEVGYGLEGTLTDGKTGNIQDKYIIPYLKNNNYNEGIKNGFSAILQEVSNEYGVKIEEQQTPNFDNNSEINQTELPSIVALIAMFIGFFAKNWKRRLLYAGIAVITGGILGCAFNIEQAIIYGILSGIIICITGIFTNIGRHWHGGGFSGGSSSGGFSSGGGSSGGGGSTRSF